MRRWSVTVVHPTNAIAELKVNKAFVSHNMPPRALKVRCHTLTSENAKVLEEHLVKVLPGCYITTKHLKERVAETGMSASEILSNKLPDPGSTMSGEFGEILTLLFLRSERSELTRAIKKWRYKLDRQKPAPFSDVIILHRESASKSSTKDFVICAESKQKSTDSSFCPISKAIEGYVVDSIGRLARTLVWLKEKAIDEESKARIDYVSRFTDDLSSTYSKYFKAVAIVDTAILDNEIVKKISLPPQSDGFEIIVLGVNNLKNLYETIYGRAIKEVSVG